MTPFPDALRTYRQQLGLSQAGLAERWGVSTRAVEEWEAGRKRPLETIIRRLMELDRPEARNAQPARRTRGAARPDSP